jgi:hypothetical protein
MGGECYRRSKALARDTARARLFTSNLRQMLLM